MKVVIAGGSGLIGRGLCAALVEAGHEPVILTRDPTRIHQLRGVRAIAWQPPELGPWTEELDGAAAVVNLAGASVGGWWWTPRRRRELRNSRIAPTAALVTAMRELPVGARPRVLLNASGTDVYEGQDASAADEATVPASTFLARLVLDWEEKAAAAESYGVRVVMLRTSLVIARDAPSLRLMTLPFRFFVGGRIGSGRQWVSWITLEDAVNLIVRAIDDDRIRGPVNLAAPDPRQQAAVARSIGRALGRPSWLRTPAWLVRLLLGEMATLALGSRRVWPARALTTGFQFQTASMDAALEQVLAGHEP